MVFQKNLQKSSGGPYYYNNTVATHSSETLTLQKHDKIQYIIRVGLDNI